MDCMQILTPRVLYVIHHDQMDRCVCEHTVESGEVFLSEEWTKGHPKCLWVRDDGKVRERQGAVL